MLSAGAKCFCRPFRNRFRYSLSSLAGSTKALSATEDTKPSNVPLGPHSEPSEIAAQNEYLRGVLISLGLTAHLGPNYKPDPLLRQQLTVDNQKEVLEATMTPLVRMPYEDQLRFKYLRNRNLVRNISKTLAKRIPDVYLDPDGLICPVDPIIPSPVTENFRNKDELSIGRSVDGQPKQLGYYVGRSNENNAVSIFPDTLINMKDSHRLVAEKFQEYMRISQYDGIEITSAGAFGHWKSVIIRSNIAGELMAIAIMHPQSLSQDELNAEKLRLKEFFVNGPGSVCRLKSLYFQACPHHICSPLQARYELLFGKDNLMEQCGNYKFRVSPNSFFQLNTQAAEVLYKKIGEFLKPNRESILLDVCCGTGTIGLFLASKFDKVIGVERELLAVGDANFNADLNGIINATFYCGNATKLIPRILKDKSNTYSSVSAVVNPGRAGLPVEVINALRNSPEVDRVVYVSCKPIANAMRNMIDLCLPPSKNLIGEPFYPVRAVPVDLFPHTDHCELVILYERNRLYFI
ncbi:tRNA (uracil-5-)-methyltransferase homolog B-like [Paramacrobiotus metropolitanus]|uniref:tRNA (uracil-5-)-methyltransferase homolog B-like n=1 Tax=Paramacrobiotus metropolitanus TaxID=2943436 RepID=UPI002445AC7D|nr:tRNA (uracil-5-)-methyltransferase homolog B-like [Paramacrobiotus metropolitanus]